MRTNRILYLALTLCVATAALAQAGDFASVETSAAAISWRPQADYERLTLTVSGPGDFYLTREFKAGEDPLLTIFDRQGSPFPDGTYSYELRVTPRLSAELRRELIAARASEDPALEAEALRRVPAGAFQAGYFSISKGELVAPTQEQPLTPTSPLESAARPLRNMAGQVVLTSADGVIRNSLCVGFDCPNSPVFSDSTILLMENNTRIKFGDTSNAPFPNNDWEIEANSSLSGGQSYLGFNDCGTADNDGGCATDLVFAVEAGARQNALYVESDGDVGFGTSNPVVNLHAVDGNTPTLRLEQDGSSGFAPQTWDVAGNETNFFIRDVTGGSTLPFRIQPGAPTNSIYIANDGDIGMGTTTPGTTSDGGENVLLRVTSSVSGDGGILIENTNAAVGGRTMMELKNFGNTFFDLNNTNAHNWRIRSSNDNHLIFDDRADAGTEFDLAPDGTLLLEGAVVQTSARAAKENFLAVDPAQILGTVARLPLSFWSYKSHSDARHLGPMAEDFFAAFGLGDTDKGISILDAAGVALAAIQGLNQVVEQKDAVIERLQARSDEQAAHVDELTARLADLEALVAKLAGTQQ